MSYMMTAEDAMAKSADAQNMRYFKRINDRIAESAKEGNYSVNLGQFSAEEAAFIIEEAQAVGYSFGQTKDRPMPEGVVELVLVWAEQLDAPGELGEEGGILETD